MNKIKEMKGMNYDNVLVNVRVWGGDDEKIHENKKGKSNLEEYRRVREREIGDILLRKICLRWGMKKKAFFGRWDFVVYNGVGNRRI